MRLKNVGDSIYALKSIQNVITTMSNFKGLSVQSETIRRLKDVTSGYSTETLRLAIAQTTLNETQIKAILSSKGLEGQILETTTAELAQVTANNANAASQKAAAASTGEFSLALKGLTTSLGTAKLVIMGAFAALTIGYTVIRSIKQAEEELRQSTEEAANAYKESASSINDYVAHYKELHQALLEAKGNEEETYNIKKQLLDLQTELNDKFGEEYGKINLVTDAYKDQTDALRFARHV